MSNRACYTASAERFVTGEIDSASYCRDIEAYLCRRNDGHLIRIVGPAFHLVTGWAESGIPLAIARHGIDRYFDRYYSKGPRRRPVRIEFCEADVQDVFDDWRRAVGVSRVSAGPLNDHHSTLNGSAGWPSDEEDAEHASTSADDPRPVRGRSLPAHLTRVIERLAERHPSEPRPPELDAVIAEIAAELGTVERRAKGLRGHHRQAALVRLATLDDRLMNVARVSMASEWPAIEDRARGELRPFAATMTPEAFAEAVGRASERLLRSRLRLPALRFD